MKKSFRLSGHATSVALEPLFWDVLNDIADAQNISLTRLVFRVDTTTPPNLASALRLYAMEYLKQQAETLKPAHLGGSLQVSTMQHSMKR